VDDSKSLSYFLLGLGIGVAAGIMFAPQAGSETRGTIRRKAVEGGDALRRRTEELRDSAGNLVDRGRDLVTRQRQQFSSAVDVGKQAYRDTIDQAQSGLPGELSDAAEGV
jgi:gas vesicle protein